MVGSVSVYVAIGIFALALWGGWYGRRLWQAGQDVKAAKARLAGATKANWSARRIALLVGGAIVIAADFYLHKHGG